MGWIKDKFVEALIFLFETILKDIDKAFSNMFIDIMGLAQRTLEMPFVQNTISYAQILALAILAPKVISEGINQYILYNSGDPDADPSGLIIRTGKSIAVISTLPWVVTQIFIFGTKVANDVASVGLTGAGSDMSGFVASFITFAIGSAGLPIIILAIIVLILILVIAVQAVIRGAELALMAVIGPIMALNISANNSNVWSAWLKQVIIICMTQALQIFMLRGATALMTAELTNGGIFLILGWVWVAVKTPKFLQQFAHSTGFSGAAGGTAKQAGSMAVMRMVMRR